MASVRPGDPEGLIPLYDFMLAFLNGVQQKTIGEFLTNNDIESWSDVSSYWEEAARGTAGFLACVIVGVLFILIFSLVGAIFCCCKCCGRCAPEKKMAKWLNKGNSNRCRKYTCSAVLLVVAAVMFALVICNYVATTRVKEELEGKTTGDVTQALGYTAEYLEDTTDEVYQGVFPPLNATTEAVLAELYNLPVTAQQELSTQTGIDPALYLLVNYTQSLPALQADLENIDTQTASLQVDALNLEDQLAQIRLDIDGILVSCSVPCEGSITDNLPNLTPATNYTEVKNMSSYAWLVGAAVDSELIEATEQLLVNYETISQAIANVTNDKVSELEREIAEFTKTLMDGYEEMKNISDNAIEHLQEWSEIVEEDIQPILTQYAPAAFVPLYIFATLAFCISVLILVAVPLGLAWPSHAARMLMASVIMIFTLGWLFMLLTVTFFAAGGATETMACRHLRTFDSSAQKMASVSRNDIGIEYNLTLEELLDSCKQDETVYTALNVEENVVNVSDVLKVQGSVIEEVLIEIAGTPISIPEVTVITDEVAEAVGLLDNLTSTIPYNSVYEATSQPVTLYDLEVYANDLYTAAEDVTDPSTKEIMIQSADDLTALANGLVAEMEEKRQSMNSSAVAAQAVTDTDVVTIVNNLTIAQELVNKESETIVSATINDTCLEVYYDIDSFSQELVKSIEQDIGGCLPIFDASRLMIYSACAYMLHPLNALWFTYGGIIVLASLAVWFAVALTGVYRVDAKLAKVGPSPDLSLTPDYLRMKPLKPYPDPDYK